MINKGTIALGVLVGTAIGASLGVLLAPEKGKATRKKLTDEAENIKDQISKDFIEVKEDLSKSYTSGKETLEKELDGLSTKASRKTEHVILFLEKQLAILKEKNKKFQNAE